MTIRDADQRPIDMLLAFADRMPNLIIRVPAALSELARAIWLADGFGARGEDIGAVSGGSGRSSVEAAIDERFDLVVQRDEIVSTIERMARLADRLNAQADQVLGAVRLIDDVPVCSAGVGELDALHWQIPDCDHRAEVWIRVDGGWSFRYPAGQGGLCSRCNLRRFRWRTINPLPIQIGPGR